MAHADVTAAAVGCGLKRRSFATSLLVVHFETAAPDIASAVASDAASPVADADTVTEAAHVASAVAASAVADIVTAAVADNAFAYAYVAASAAAAPRADWDESVESAPPAWARARLVCSQTLNQGTLARHLQ